jgi:hypothetical protein
VRENFGSIIGDLFKSLFELAAEFRHEDISDAILPLIKLFSNELLPQAVELSQALLALFLHSGGDADADRAEAILRAFHKLIEIVARDVEARAVIAPQIFVSAVQILKELADPPVIDQFILPLNDLIAAAVFHPEFWEAAPILAEKFELPISVTDSLDIFSHFLVKDHEFAQRGDLPQFLVDFTMTGLRERRAEFIEWSEFAKLMASIILRLTNHSVVVAAIPELAAMILENFDKEDVLGMVLLMNSLIMTNFPDTMAALGGRADVYIRFWLDHPVFPETVAAAIATFDAFDAALQADVLYSITDMLCGDLLTRSPDDGDEFDQDADSNTSYVWFDFPATLNAFADLLEAAQPGPAFQQFAARLAAEGAEECAGQLAGIRRVAEAYESSKG